MRRVVLLSLALPACTAGLGGPTGVRGTDYRGDEIRRPAITMHLGLGEGDFTKQERATLPELYTVALLEALNAEAVLPVDVRVGGGRLDRTAAVARAREVGADQAVVVDATVARRRRTYCRHTRRTFTTGITEWVVRVDVVRASDRETRLLEPGIQTTDFREDCDAPESSQRLGPNDAIRASVQKVVGTILRP